MTSPRRSEVREARIEVTVRVKTQREGNSWIALFNTRLEPLTAIGDTEAEALAYLAADISERYS